MEALQTVQLHHVLPCGGGHIDWMLELNGAGGTLTTFRAPRRIDELAPGEQVPLERLSDHRRAYLTYEGPVPGGRGAVNRLARGAVVMIAAEAGGWRLGIAWGEMGAAPAANTPVQRLRLRAVQPPRWLVEAMPAEPGDAGEPKAVATMGAARGVA